MRLTKDFPDLESLFESPQVQVESKPVEKLDPQALEEGLKQLPHVTIEAESAHDQRLFDQWGSSK